MPTYEKAIFVVLLRDGSWYLIESDDWRYDEQAKAFRFFDVDETPEGPQNHEVAWLSAADVMGVAERERISQRRDGAASPAVAGAARNPAAGAARRKAAARRAQE